MGQEENEKLVGLAKQVVHIVLGMIWKRITGHTDKKVKS